MATENSIPEVIQSTEIKEEPVVSRKKEIAKQVWDYLYSQWFFFALAILIIIARWWPQFES